MFLSKFETNKNLIDESTVCTYTKELNPIEIYNSVFHHTGKLELVIKCILVFVSVLLITNFGPYILVGLWAYGFHGKRLDATTSWVQEFVYRRGVPEHKFFGFHGCWAVADRESERIMVIDHTGAWVFNFSDITHLDKHNWKFTFTTNSEKKPKFVVYVPNERSALEAIYA